MVPREFTFLAVGVGLMVGVVMTAANVYLGLYAGMTVSASIPAAVIAMGVFRGILKRQSILESNLVQTIASAGESIAGGIIFTLPALVLVGAWQDFKFWPTTLIAIAGGLLGVGFMVPLRRALIIEEKALTYPEGVACATVLESGSSDSGDGIKMIAKGLLIGGVIKFFSGGLALLQGSVEYATKIKNSVFFVGTDVSPALLAVGYIVRLQIAMLVFIGGAIGWVFGIPLFGVPAELSAESNLDTAWTLWSTQIRYMGVGAMVVGGVFSIISVRSGIVSGLRRLVDTYQGRTNVTAERTELDIPLSGLVAILTVAVALVFGIYWTLVGSFAVSLFTTVVMVALAFIFVAVSSYIVGLVGTSNNPVSGMTISALLVTAVLFLILGYKGDSAILATLGVAAVVCCAATTSGDCSQDLKTGVLVGATPKYQQMGQVIGVLIPAFVIAPVLSLLHSSYGIGTGLKAPQATLFASLTQALFGDGALPYRMVAIGAVLGVVVLIADNGLEKAKSRYRLHLMPLAVGIYLPITLAVPILLGGIMRYFVERHRAAESEGSDSDSGVLVSSGFIAGESIMGILIALLIFMNIDLTAALTKFLGREEGASLLGSGLSSFLSIGVLAAVAYYVFRVGRSDVVKS
jgi:putative OPT family oligopeptide transporter